MKWIAVVAALVALVLATACGSESADNVDGGSATGDGPDGTGCTALTPRSQPVESFIGPSGLQTRMGDLIDGAQSSLDIQMYLFTVKELANKLVDAKVRGVAIRLIMDPDEPGNDNVEPILTSGGVNWKNASPLYTFSHAKYVIADHSQAVIMSMNWNVDAMINERNYGVVDRDAEDVSDLQAIFEQDWLLANGQSAAAPDLTCTRLIVSPTNSKMRLLDHIKSAQSTLDIEVMYISETTIRNEILAAKARGVTVRVIVEDSSDEVIPVLQDAGIPVKVPGPYYLHAKLIIADDVAFVGSENMSFTSLSKNREIGALVFEPAAFAPIQSQFETDWSNSVAQ
jgi:phosphatidylserine/phosphatidylglycerophosphate/cardiolipin synthase-like enzyme